MKIVGKMSADKSPAKQTSGAAGGANYLKYVFGGAAGMGATCVVQPLDLVKTRMQIQGTGADRLYKNTFDAVVKIFKGEGITGLYNGLGAGLLRQATYTMTRLGVYNAMLDQYKSRNDNRMPNLFESMGMGMCAGAVGAFVGTPAEVSLIRMTADGRLPMEQRRNYKHVGNALSRIVTEEGVLTLWRGCIPTIGRAMVVNMAQLASYTQAKKMLLESGHFTEGIFMHFTASMISGLITTIASMPVDMAKTRIQNMRTAPGATPEYKGSIDVLLKVSRKEGVLSLWKGFTPYYCRLGPHTVITFILLEQMTTAYSNYLKNGAN